MSNYCLCLSIELALSPSNEEVHIYKRESTKWSLETVLTQHDLRVTSIDWAPKSNKIVTCSAVSVCPPFLIEIKLNQHTFKTGSKRVCLVLRWWCLEAFRSAVKDKQSGDLC